MSALLQVRNLGASYPGPAGTVRALEGVDFEVAARESVGIVGESGAGKSQLALSVLGLLPASAQRSGSIAFDGEAVQTPAQWQHLRGRGIGTVFQDPLTSLNPYLKLGTQLTEGLVRHYKLAADEARTRAIEMLGRVGLGAPEQRLRQYPHQISGGMRQRVALAMALLCQPRLLIADEPTSALDVTVQAQVLKLIRELRAQFGLALLLITHDFGIIAQTCDRVLVVYAGRIVESGPTAQILAAPRHPYTRGLLAARPSLEGGASPLASIPGAPPDPRARPPGCAFAPRCARADAACSERPPLAPISHSQSAACWHPYDR